MLEDQRKRKREIPGNFVLLIEDERNYMRNGEAGVATCL